MVRRCVWSRNLKNEEAMTRVGSQRHNKIITLYGVSLSTGVQRFEISEFYCYKFGGHANWPTLKEAGVKLCKGGTEAEGGLWVWGVEQLAAWDGREAAIVHPNCVLLSFMSVSTQMYTVPQKMALCQIPVARPQQQNVFVQTARYFCPILTKLGFPPQILRWFIPTVFEVQIRI